MNTFSSFPRASARTAVAVVLAALWGGGCDLARQPDVRRGSITPVYDKATGRLTELAYDSNGNGKTDTRTLMDGTRVLRVEIDKNEDGLIERWEHYGADQKLEKVGFSRANDGKADAWAFRGPDGQLARVEISTRRDGRVSRIEYYERAALARAEEDTDADGRTDKWETYAGSAVASVAFDSLGRGVPDRRLFYRPDGSLDRIETDADGDGAFDAQAAGRDRSPLS